MFDHLYRAPANRLVRVRLHHHGLVFFIVVGVLSGAVVLLAQTALLGAGVPERSIPTSVQVRLAHDTDRVAIVGPLRSWPFAELAVVVSGDGARLDTVQFTLDGVYDVHAIRGIGMFLNGAQIGPPSTPDADGIVSFTSNTVTLEAGEHHLIFRMTTEPSDQQMVFQAAFDEAQSIRFAAYGGGASISSLLPARAPLVTVSNRGSIGYFVRGTTDDGSAGMSLNRVFTYATGEDFRLTGLVLEASRDLTGNRIDIFKDDVFLTTAVFAGGAAQARFDDPVVRILRGKNTILTMLPSFDPSSFSDDARITIVSIEAEGYTSRSTLLLDTELSVR
ncbi:MAG: hypothetical protein AAB490_05965 [Patescibacteria group bacterium]